MRLTNFEYLCNRNFCDWLNLGRFCGRNFCDWPVLKNFAKEIFATEVVKISFAIVSSIKVVSWCIIQNPRMSRNDPLGDVILTLVSRALFFLYENFREFIIFVNSSNVRCPQQGHTYLKKPFSRHQVLKG